MYNMKISLHMMYEELLKRFPTTADIQHDERCISDIRLQMTKCNLDRRYIYVYPDDECPDYTVFWHEHGRIEVAASWIDATNAAMEIMGNFRYINQRLNEAILSSQPFQAIAEITSEVMNAPTSITNNAFKVLGIAGKAKGAPWDSKIELWEYMKVNGASPPNFVGYFTHPSRFQVYLMDHAPLQQMLPSFCNWKAILRINCFYNDEAKCRLGIQTLDDCSTLGTIHLAECFGNAIECIPSSVCEPFFNTRALPERYLSENGNLLPGNNPLRDAVERTIGTSDFYLCHMATLYKSKNLAGAYWLCSCLDHLNDSSCAWLHEDNVLFLIRATDTIQDTLSAELLPLLRETGFSCAVSNRCSNISHLGECLKQTQRLQNISPQRCPRILFYKNHAEACLMDELSSQVDIGAWLHPGLHTLEIMDAREKTDNFRTLACLAKNKFQQNITADELYIHRNSLQYRIKRIEQILDCDLSDPNTRWFLTLSIYLYKQ